MLVRERVGFKETSPWLRYIYLYPHWRKSWPQASACGILLSLYRCRRDARSEGGASLESVGWSERTAKASPDGGGKDEWTPAGRAHRRVGRTEAAVGVVRAGGV